MRKNIVVTNDYGEMPVSLNIVKSFLRVVSQDDDDLIMLLLKSVIDFAECKLGIVIGKKDYLYKLCTNNSEIILPRFPVKSVNFVKVLGEDVQFEICGKFLKIKANIENAELLISFTAENLNIGESLKVVLLRHVFFLYENRSVSEINVREVDSIYQSLIENNYNL